MESRRRPRPFYDTGGSGLVATSQGEAYRWWLPYAFTSLPRLLMGTRLAQGPASLKELERVSGGYQSVVWHIVQAWVRNRFATWKLEHGGGRRGVHLWREVTLTDEARRALWRFGWVTRQLLFSVMEDAPLRDDMPEDPLAALRRYARPEFLRPAALVVLDQLLGWPKQNVRQMGGYTGIPGATRHHMDRFRAAGFVTDLDDEAVVSRVGSRSPKWVLNETGLEAVGRHVDALRRVCVASGYVPTKECEIWHPLEFASPCTATMRPDVEPPCGAECMWWWSVVSSQGAGGRIQDSGFRIQPDVVG